MTAPKLIVTALVADVDVVLIDERRSTDISVVLRSLREDLKHAVVVSPAYYAKFKAACPDADDETLALALEQHIRSKEGR